MKSSEATGARLALPLLLLFLVLAVIVPVTGFFDLYLLPWQARLIFLEHPSLWHAMRDNPAAYLPFTDFSALPYGPVFYYPLGLWLYFLDKLHVIDLVAWYDFGVATRSMRYTTLLKAPNLAVYVAIGLVLLRTLPGRAGQDAMLLWLLNPAVIMISFVMGQNDSWSMLSVLVALLLAARALEGREHVGFGPVRVPARPLAMAALGIGAAVKLHPLLFVVPFGFVLGRSWRERAFLAAIAGAVFGLLILPFVFDPFFRKHALFNPQSKDILYHRVGRLPAFYPLFGLALLLALVSARRGFQSLLVALMTVHLIIFGLTNWAPERAAWFVGALVLPAALNRLALAAYVLVTLQFFLAAMEPANGLGAGMFSLMSRQFDLWLSLDGSLDRVWSFDRFQDVGLWLGVVVWLAALVVALPPRSTRAPPVPALVPIAVLCLLPAFLAGTLAYGALGWSTSPGGARGGGISGPAVIEQTFSALTFSGLDVAFEPGPSGEPIRATVQLTQGAESIIPATVTPSGDRYVRLRFDEPVLRGFGRDLHVLRVELPAGARVGTVDGTRPGYLGATIDSAISPTIVDLRVNRDPSWTAIARDVRHRYGAEAGVVAFSCVLLATALSFVWWQGTRHRAVTPSESEYTV